MSRQLKTLFIMLAVLVVLGGVFAFVMISPKFKGSSSSSTSSSASITLIKTDVSNIKSLYVLNQQGTYTITRTASKSWAISGLGTAPIVSTSLESACESAASLSATSLVTKDAANIAQYGLDKPQGTISVTMSDGKEYTYLIGNETPMSDGYYIAAKDSSTVYITSTDVETYFLASPNTFVDMTLLTVDTTNDAPNITNFTFGGSKRGAPISINIPPASSSSASSMSGVNIDASPYIVSPRLLADSTQLSNLDSDIASVSASSVVSLDVSKASLEKYGLKDPAYTFSYTLKGKTTTLLFGDTTTSASSTSSGSEESIYVMKEGVNVVYSIPTSSVAFYNWSVDNLISSLQFVINIDDIKTMTVSGGGKTWAFNLSGTGDNTKVTINGKTLDTSNFRNYYQNVISMAFTGLMSKPANAKLYAQVTCAYKIASKGTRTMSFYTVDDQRCYWEVNGTGGMYVLKTTVDKLLEQAQMVTDGKTVTAQ